MRIIFLSLIFSLPMVTACTMQDAEKHLSTAKDYAVSAKNYVLEKMPDDIYATDTRASNPHIVAEAFKEALSIASDSVTGQLGSLDGFYRNAAVKIPLPPKLQQAGDIMDKMGLGYLPQDLIKKMNRAAEIATPHAKDLFVQAVQDLSFEDVMRIYNGAPDSATRYFEGEMASPLAAAMRPHLERTIGREGVIMAYNRFADQVSGPFNLNIDITSYVLDRTMEGIFTMIAKKEAAIRTNPAEQTSQLLQDVFGKREGFINRAIDQGWTSSDDIRKND